MRGDRLLAWKWKDRVLDRNAATDADQDAALALVLAWRRFGEPRYLDEARGLLRDVWEKRGRPSRAAAPPDRRELGPGRAVPDRPRRLPRAVRVRGVRRGGPRAALEGARPLELRPAPLPLRGPRGRPPARARLPRPAHRRDPARAAGRRRTRPVRLRRGADLLARRARRAVVRAARRGGRARADAALPAGGVAGGGAAPRSLHDRGAPALHARRPAAPRLGAGARAARGPGARRGDARGAPRRDVRAGALRRADPVLPPQLALVRARARARGGPPLRRAALLPPPARLGRVPGELPAPSPRGRAPPRPARAPARPGRARSCSRSPSASRSATSAGAG